MSTNATDKAMSAEVDYVRRHHLGQILDLMVVHLLKNKPLRPVHALRVYALAHASAGTAAAAALAALALSSGDGLGGAAVDTDSKRPSIDPFSASRTGSFVVILPHRANANSSFSPDQQPLAGGGHPSQQGPPGRRRKSVHKTRGGGTSPRVGSTTSAPRHSTGLRSDHSASGLWDGADPLVPPTGIMGEQGATLRRRSQAMYANALVHTPQRRSQASTEPGPTESPRMMSQNLLCTGSEAASNSPEIVRRKVDCGSLSMISSPPGGAGPRGRQQQQQQHTASADEFGEKQGTVMFEQQGSALPTAFSVCESDFASRPSSAGESSCTGLSRPAQPKKNLGFGGHRGVLPAVPEPGSGVDVEEEIRMLVQEDDDILDLHDCRMLSVPPSLCQLGAQIVHLDLSSNSIKALPSEIGQLLRLEYLSVKSNDLTALPDEVCMLTDLEELYLDHNELKSLPADLAKLQKLRILGLDWNDLAGFPVQLCDMPKLTMLYIVENPEVDKLPAADVLGRMAQGAVMHIDNIPSLVEQWKELSRGDPLPCRVEWNSIYPDCIIPKLFLGSLRSAQQVRIYTDLGITHVASIGRELTVVLAQGMKQLQLNVDDLAGVDLTPFFDESHAFIDQAMETGAVLVHCFKGQSRSATVVITYLMRKRMITRDAAIAEVKKSRPCINPNPGFMNIMLAYEKQLGIS